MTSADKVTSNAIFFGRWQMRRHPRVRVCLLLSLSAIFLVSGCGSQVKNTIPYEGQESPSNLFMYRANMHRTGEYTTNNTFTTPQVLWQYKSDSWITSSPLVTDDAVFFTANDGNLHKLDLPTGKHKWQTVAYKASPAVEDGILYYGWKNLIALNEHTQNLLWESNTAGEPIESSPLISETTIFFGADDGYMYAVDKASGSIKWKFQAGKYVDSAPALANQWC